MTRYRGMGLASRGQGATAAISGSSKPKAMKNGGITGPSGKVKDLKVTSMDANAHPTAADGYKKGGVVGGDAILGRTVQHGHYASKMPKMPNPRSAAGAQGGYPIPDEGEMGGAAGETAKGTIEPQPSRGFKRGGAVKVKRMKKGGSTEDEGGDTDALESRGYGTKIMGKTGKMEEFKAGQSLAPEYKTADKKSTLFKQGGLVAKRPASGIHRRGDAYADGGAVRLHYSVATSGKAPSGSGKIKGGSMLRGPNAGKNTYEKESGSSLPKNDLRVKKGGAK